MVGTYRIGNRGGRGRIRFGEKEQNGEDECTAKTQPENKLIIDGEHDADNRGTQRPANTAKHPRATKFEITATADFLDKCLYCWRTGVKTKAKINTTNNRSY